MHRQQNGDGYGRSDKQGRLQRLVAFDGTRLRQRPKDTEAPTDGRPMADA